MSDVDLDKPPVPENQGTQAPELSVQAPQAQYADGSAAVQEDQQAQSRLNVAYENSGVLPHLQLGNESAIQSTADAGKSQPAAAQNLLQQGLAAEAKGVKATQIVFDGIAGASGQILNQGIDAAAQSLQKNADALKASNDNVVAKGAIDVGAKAIAFGLGAGEGLAKFAGGMVQGAADATLKAAGENIQDAAKDPTNIGKIVGAINPLDAAGRAVADGVTDIGKQMPQMVDAAGKGLNTAMNAVGDAVQNPNKVVADIQGALADSNLQDWAHAGDTAGQVAPVVLGGVEALKALPGLVEGVSTGARGLIEGTKALTSAGATAGKESMSIGDALTSIKGVAPGASETLADGSILDTYDNGVKVFTNNKFETETQLPDGTVYKQLKDNSTSTWEPHDGKMRLAESTTADGTKTIHNLDGSEDTWKDGKIASRMSPNEGTTTAYNPDGTTSSVTYRDNSVANFDYKNGTISVREANGNSVVVDMKTGAEVPPPSAAAAASPDWAVAKAEAPAPAATASPDWAVAKAEAPAPAAKAASPDWAVAKAEAPAPAATASPDWAAPKPEAPAPKADLGKQTAPENNSLKAQASGDGANMARQEVNNKAGTISGGNTKLDEIGKTILRPAQTTVRESKGFIDTYSPDGTWTHFDKGMPDQIQKHYNVQQLDRLQEARQAALDKGIPYDDGIESKFRPGANVKTSDMFQGWKIHLNVPTDINDPLVSDITKTLDAKGISYKVGQGGAAGDGAGMTIYAGPRDQMETIANDLHQQFNGRLPKAVNGNDQFVHDDICARFDVERQSVGDGFVYDKYGTMGISDISKEGGFNRPSDTPSGLWADDSEMVKYRSKIHDMLVKKYGAYYSGTEPYISGDLSFKGKPV